MTNAEIAAALQSLRPRAVWSLSGDTYAGLVWLDAVQTKPLDTEVTAEITRLAAAKQAQALRDADIRSDPGRADLMGRLAIATPAQIDTWVDNNVTTIGAARTVLKAIIKVIALDARS